MDPPSKNQTNSKFENRSNWNLTNGNILGVLQILVPASEYRAEGDIDATLDRIAEAVSSSLFLIQHQSSVEYYRQQIREEKDRVTAHRDDLQNERSTWHSNSEMWKSVSESAMVLLSASVGAGTVSFAQAVRLTKQFKHVIQREIDEFDKLKVLDKEGVKKTEGRTLDQRSQAIGALKSILSDTRGLHVLAAGNQNNTV